MNYLTERDFSRILDHHEANIVARATGVSHNEALLSLKEHHTHVRRYYLSMWPSFDLKMDCWVYGRETPTA